MSNVLSTPKLDSQHMLESIDLLSQQVQQGWLEASRINVPTAEIDRVVLFGMGGSALGFDIVRGVFAQRCRVPLTIENSYHTPAYVNNKTLAILSSYSGTTEETLTVAKTIAQHTPHVVVITTGGPLGDFAEQQGYPTYRIIPTHNPCNQPRIAVGYAVTGLLGLLRQANIIDVTDQEIDDVVHYLDGNRELLRDAAAELAAQLTGQIPLVVASEFLLGNAHVLANQLNENGKNFATYFPIPELNHHLMEGLAYPTTNSASLHFVLVESHLYHERIQKRYQVTREVLERTHISANTFVATANTPLLQAFEVLQWGSYVSFYMAQANAVDPSPIPWVDFFKHALK